MPIPVDSTPNLHVCAAAQAIVCARVASAFSFGRHDWKEAIAIRAFISASTGGVSSDKACAKRYKKICRKIRGGTNAGRKSSDVEAKAGRLCDDLAAASCSLPEASLSTYNPLPSIKISHRIAIIHVADGLLSWHCVVITIPRSEACHSAQLSVRRPLLW